MSACSAVQVSYLKQVSCKNL